MVLWDTAHSICGLRSGLVGVHGKDFHVAFEKWSWVMVGGVIAKFASVWSLRCICLWSMSGVVNGWIHRSLRWMDGVLVWWLLS